MRVVVISGVATLLFVDFLRFVVLGWVTNGVFRIGVWPRLIARLRTASGATAVQIVEKQGRKNVVLKHVGSAHNEIELAVLMQTAQD